MSESKQKLVQQNVALRAECDRLRGIIIGLGRRSPEALASAEIICRAARSSAPAGSGANPHHLVSRSGPAESPATTGDKR